MRSIRTTIVAASTAAAVALSATPAFAQSAEDSESSTSSTSSFGGSSAVADELDATDSQRNVWGSSKDFDNANGFDQLTYVYTVGSLAALVGGAAAFASQTPQAREIAKQFNIDLPRFF